jgi:hypothetical protein
MWLGERWFLRSEPMIAALASGGLPRGRALQASDKGKSGASRRSKARDPTEWERPLNRRRLKFFF